MIESRLGSAEKGDGIRSGKNDRRRTDAHTYAYMYDMHTYMCI